jgi:hypothetical protein
MFQGDIPESMFTVLLPSLQKDLVRGGYLDIRKDLPGRQGGRIGRGSHKPFAHFPVVDVVCVKRAGAVFSSTGPKVSPGDADRFESASL